MAWAPQGPELAFGFHGLGARKARAAQRFSASRPGLRAPENPTTMDQNPTPDPSQIDPAKIQALQQRLLGRQNLPAAIGAGAISALVGATVWAVVTVSSNYQIGWMAVGVGFLVGWAVRMAGKGVTQPFGIIGAVFALLGCALGNLFSIYGFAAKGLDISLFSVIGAVPFSTVLSGFAQAMQPMDFLFYGIAVYEGYKFSFHTASAEDLAALR